MAVKCAFCEKNADPGWSTCGDCGFEQVEQTEQEEQEEEYGKTYAEQEELEYLDEMLFGKR